MLAALTIAAARIFATIDVQSYRFDDALTAKLLAMPFGDMLSRIPDTELTPPLHYARPFRGGPESSQPRWSRSTRCWSGTRRRRGRTRCSRSCADRRTLHVRNAPSPAATSALAIAIAREIADRAEPLPGGV